MSDGAATLLIEAAKAAVDPTFRAKFIELPAILARWAEQVGGLGGKRVLDFGCGNGTTACGVALVHRPQLMHGIDINPEHRECLAVVSRQVPLHALPANLSFEQIKPSGVGSVGDLDFIYAWSVFEHLDRAMFDAITASLRTQLRPGGCLFVQIEPLFYSAEGAHLRKYGVNRWEHLTLQLNDLRRRVLEREGPSIKERETDWRTFETLNRMTSPELIRRITAQGFGLVREYYTQNDVEPHEDILAVFDRRVLTTNQIVALFQRVD